MCIRDRLYNYRISRTHLHKDDKILVSWNGWMICACVKAGAVLKEKKYIDLAVRAETFIHKTPVSYTHLDMPAGHLFYQVRVFFVFAVQYGQQFIRAFSVGGISGQDEHILFVSVLYGFSDGNGIRDSSVQVFVVPDFYISGQKGKRTGSLDGYDVFSGIFDRYIFSFSGGYIGDYRVEGTVISVYGVIVIGI